MEGHDLAILPAYLGPTCRVTPGRPASSRSCAEFKGLATPGVMARSVAGRASIQTEESGVRPAALLAGLWRTVMAKVAEKTDPDLWEAVKAEVTASEKGGKPGQWSARKAQIAVRLYEERGGGFKGLKTEDNHLLRWEREAWDTKSGGKSLETGERYLPKAAREALTPEEYRRTTAKKRTDLNHVYFEKRSFSSSGSRRSLTQRRSAMTKGSRFRRTSKSAPRRVRSSALAWQW